VHVVDANAVASAAWVSASPTLRGGNRRRYTHQAIVTILMTTRDLIAAGQE
jgi:hypothetical protein